MTPQPAISSTAFDPAEDFRLIVHRVIPSYDY